MAASTVRPHLLVANAQGEIIDDPDLLLVCRRGEEWGLPRPEELILMPEDSDLFLLPGRRAVGYDPETGEIEQQEDLAVSAFVAPGYTLTGHPVYVSDADAPMLPLFAYGAVGYYNHRFYVCAKRVDSDPRQVFSESLLMKVQKEAKRLIKKYPDNRLMQHLMHQCALRYACPAARNLCLGRYEAPLPVSRTCNARCLGCISQQEDGSKICATPQNRMSFTPTANEVLEVMRHHARQEVKTPIFSFGQGCEGEPLTEGKLLEEVISRFRAGGGRGTVNLNSNASRPEVIEALAKAGLSSLRVSMNAAREKPYTRYYRPQGYDLDNVFASMRIASDLGVHVAVNLLYFPGITDTEAELEALIDCFQKNDVRLVQLRNLNIDPEYYLDLMRDCIDGPAVGLNNFCKRIKKACPDIVFGYFNPYLDEMENKVDSSPVS